MPAGVGQPVGAYYNGVTMDVTLEPVEIEVTPVKDSAGRVVVYNRHVITLAAYVTPGLDEADTDALMLAVRQQLTQIGGELRISGAGCDLHVNQPGGGGLRDVMKGPVPEILSESQRGADQAWHVRWRVTVCISCEPDDTKQDRLLWWNYTANYRIDEFGQTTRNIAGSVRIPWSKKTVGDRTIDRNIDQWREEVVDSIGLPPGYRRTDRSWDITADKMEARFSVTDVQFEWLFAPPPGIIKVNRSHSMDTVKASNFNLLTHSFSGEYHVARQTPKVAVWNYFMEELGAKWAAIKKNKRQTLIPLALSLQNDEDSMRVRCSCRWTVTIDTSKAKGIKGQAEVLADAVKDSGLFLTPNFSSWDAWARPLSPNVLSSRGSSGLTLPPSADALLDLCGGIDTPPEQKPKLVPPPGGGKKPGGGGKDSGPDPDPPPPPGVPLKRSWIRFENRVRVIEREDRPVLKLLPRDGDEVKRKARPRDADDSDGWKSDVIPGAKNGNKDVVIQDRARPLEVIEITGKALRAGWSIEPPQVLEAGGVKAFALNDADCYFESRVISGLLTPICEASWKLRYVLEGVPVKPITAPDTPLGAVSGGEGRRADDGLEGTIISG